ncbi:MAG: hypothetical protein LIP10_06445 [Clostridiales bacterium]|nr:hypothetical protein [Clostridiales bacterium]
MRKIEGGLQELYKVFDDSKAEEIEKQITACLKESISFMDGGSTEKQKESSYHMLLIGMLQGHPGWLVKSNREGPLMGCDSRVVRIDRHKRLAWLKMSESAHLDFSKESTSVLVAGLEITERS